MIVAPLPKDETERLKALNDLKLLDTPLEERFERITRMVRNVFNVPIAAFTLIDKDRQWFKSAQGLEESETTRDVAFCSHAILDDEIMHVPDATSDVRFADNPFVTRDAGIRFYAGCPVRAPNGQKIGSLCAVDQKPRDLSKQEMQTLRDLASMIESELRSEQLSSIHNDLMTELDEAQRLALIDPLTRVWNRRGIFELIKRRWSEAGRNEEVIVLVMADIDHFKRINDTHGHQVGDAVIQSVSRKLLSAIREEDAVGRIGGEEFLLVLTGCEASELKRTVERIRHNVATSTIAVPKGDIEVTLSFGAAAGMPSTVKSFEELIEFAGEALYAAKKAGRNRVEVSEIKAAS